jgi:hypothetical protein
MTHGIKLTGLNNSLTVSSDSKSLIFRGKAVRRTNAGDTFYPADSTFNNADFLQQQKPNYFCGGDPCQEYSINYNYGTSVGNFKTYFSQDQYSGCSPTRNVSNIGGTFTPTRDIVNLTYTINSPTLPIVFCYSSSSDTTACVLGIANGGTSGGVTNWILKINATFLPGTAEATVAGRLTFYCFSEISSLDDTSGYGMRIYNSNSQLTFSSEKKPLVLQDYVTLTESDNPVDLADIIYTKVYCPNPKKSMFLLSKPAFMNLDFARYGNSQYAYGYRAGRAATSSAGTSVYFGQHRIRIRSHLASTGINIKNGDINISLSTIDAEPIIYDATSCLVLPSSATNGYIPFGGSLPEKFIEYKKELFPFTIPVIEGADYD